MSNLMTCDDAPNCTGMTCLSQPLPVSIVPNTGRNLSNSSYRGLNEEDYSLYIGCAVIALWVPVIFEGFVC